MKSIMIPCTLESTQKSLLGYESLIKLPGDRKACKRKWFCRKLEAISWLKDALVSKVIQSSRRKGYKVEGMFQV